jgi:hypothetical protein
MHPKSKSFKSMIKLLFLILFSMKVAQGTFAQIRKMLPLDAHADSAHPLSQARNLVQNLTAQM